MKNDTPMSGDLKKYKEELVKLITQAQEMGDDIIEAKKTSDSPAKFFSAYQSWYTKARAVVSRVLPDRLDEFQGLYKENKKPAKEFSYTIADYLLGMRPATDIYGEKKFEELDIVYMRFQTQRMILASCAERFTSSLLDLKHILQAGLFDSELDEANYLHKNGHERAAGAIAGVVLEGHLKQICEDHKLVPKSKNPSIDDLNTTLKDSGVIDIPEWRRIQRLGDIRNMCDHKKTRPPTPEEVKDLIEGVEKVIKSVF